MTRRRDPIAHTRSILYSTAKTLGDVQAGRKAIRQGSFTPVWDRMRRRILGRMASRFIR